MFVQALYGELVTAIIKKKKKKKKRSGSLDSIWLVKN